MVAVPTDEPVTRPPLDTQATRLETLRQMHCGVMSSVLPSSNVPRTVSCCVPPTVIVKACGGTASDTRCALYTVSPADAWMPDSIVWALIVPAHLTVARPCVCDEVETVTT